MKNLLLICCVTFSCLISCGSSTDTGNPTNNNNPKDSSNTKPKDSLNTIDAKTQLLGTWEMDFTDLVQDGPYSLLVSGDTVYLNGMVTVSVFNGNKVKFTQGSLTDDVYSVFDITMTDKDNFNGTYTFSDSGIANQRSTTVKANRKSQTVSQSVQCSGTTKKGLRCKNMTLNANGRCYLHQ